jgi:hypothetical protein
MAGDDDVLEGNPCHKEFQNHPFYKLFGATCAGSRNLSPASARHYAFMKFVLDIFK